MNANTYPCQFYNCNKPTMMFSVHPTTQQESGYEATARALPICEECLEKIKNRKFHSHTVNEIHVREAQRISGVYGWLGYPPAN